MNKEHLKKIVSDGMEEAYIQIWSEHMTREDFENIRSLVEMSALLVLMEVKKDMEQEK
jgi:hypothetical protein